MYDGVVTSTKTVMTIEFLVRVGLHQGSALSRYLFALMMDSLMTNIQCQDPWCMRLADDTILINWSRKLVNAMQNFGERHSN